MHSKRAARRHDPRIPADQRTPFQRDRDRLLYSDAFRRLQGVMQVVSADEGWVFHNRLTHSLKVAQVARRIAEHLSTHSDPECIEAVGGLDVDVAETAGLAHDLGHPPFGHVDPQTEPAGRLAADMVCALTDRQALVLARRISGLDPGKLMSFVM